MKIKSLIATFSALLVLSMSVQAKPSNLDASYFTDTEELDQMQKEKAENCRRKYAKAAHSEGVIIDYMNGVYGENFVTRCLDGSLWCAMPGALVALTVTMVPNLLFQVYNLPSRTKAIMTEKLVNARSDIMRGLLKSARKIDPSISEDNIMAIHERGLANNFCEGGILASSSEIRLYIQGQVKAGNY